MGKEAEETVQQVPNCECSLLYADNHYRRLDELTSGSNAPAEDQEVENPVEPGFSLEQLRKLLQIENDPGRFAVTFPTASECQLASAVSEVSSVGP